MKDGVVQSTLCDNKSMILRCSLADETIKSSFVGRCLSTSTKTWGRWQQASWADAQAPQPHPILRCQCRYMIQWSDTSPPTKRCWPRCPLPVLQKSHQRQYRPRESCLLYRWTGVCNLVESYKPVFPGFFHDAIICRYYQTHCAVSRDIQFLTT